MKLRNSLTPYPILCSFNDDYRDSNFTADIQCGYTRDKIIIKVAFHLKNEELKKLIQEEKAFCLVHIESPQTSFRKRVDTTEDQLTISLDKDDLSDSIEICTFIVAAEDIENYHNSLFNAIDEDLHISLTKGNIMAIGTSKEILLERKNQEMRDADSLIKIIRNAKGKKASIYVDTDSSDCILLGMDESLIDSYWKLGKQKYREVLFSMLFLPAMIVVLTRMKEDSLSDESSGFEDKKWYIAIMDLLDKAGYSLENLSEEDNSILEAAQVIFKNPIKMAMNALEANDVEEE